MSNQKEGKEQDTEFYLAFYGKTEHEIEGFAEKLQKEYPIIRGYSIRPHKRPINPIYLILRFDNEVCKNAFQGIPGAYEMYVDYAAKRQ